MMFLENVKEFIDSLRIPYRIVNVCSGDLGAPAYLKYDVEAWFPGFGDFRETHSASNMWDYQARRMNIKYLKNNKLIYPHTVNSTLVTDRLLLAIIENYQKKDGNVEIPEVLHTYTGGLKIIKQC
jgi:seryl-tRNA synthetase